MTAMPRRVRAWGWFMNQFASMHVSTMSPTDIAHNQTMRHVPAPIRRVVFGARDRRVRTDDRTIPGPAGPLRVRIYRPRRTIPTPGGALPAVALYLHGGGWSLFGGLDMCDWLPSRVAAEWGAIVVAVDYRLAPQHPFPAAVDDSYAALEWLASNAASIGGDPAHLAVFGDSAGGNLAAVLSHLARDAARAAATPAASADAITMAAATPASAAATPAAPATPAAGSPAPRITALGLIYPVTETTLTDASMRTNAESPVLRRADMSAFFDLYLGRTRPPAAQADPRAAPALTDDLTALPPTLVQVSAHDVLREQGIRYAERLREARVLTTLTIYHDAPHGWVTYPTIMSSATRAADELVAFLSENA